MDDILLHHLRRQQLVLYQLSEVWSEVISLISEFNTCPSAILLILIAMEQAYNSFMISLAFVNGNILS